MTYTNREVKKTFDRRAVWMMGNFDSAGRFYPDSDHDAIATKYVQAYRSPSRNWPKSYLHALYTQKFYKHYMSVLFRLDEDDAATAAEIEYQLTSKSAIIRATWAKYMAYTPTAEQIQRGLNDGDKDVAHAWLLRVQKMSELSLQSFAA